MPQQSTESYWRYSPPAVVLHWLIALFIFWQPMGGTIWQVDQPVGRTLLYAGFAFGWLLVLVTTFLINHFDLFGLRQVWLHFRGRPYTALEFKTPGLYKHVRHPLYVGWFFAFWCTPTMTAAHLFFAIMTTVYILVAIRFEERDLEEFHPEYIEYKRRTPMLVPRLAAGRIRECPQGIQGVAEERDGLHAFSISGSIYEATGLWAAADAGLRLVN